MNKTKIEWTNFSANPIKYRVGDKVMNMCVPASSGCAKCYASAITKRFSGLDFAKAAGSPPPPPG